MADIVNDGIVPGDTGAIWQIGFKMLIYALLTAASALSSSFFSAKLGTSLSRDLRNDVFEKIMSFSISEISNFSTASLITRTTNDIAQVQQTMIMCLSMALRVPMMAIIAVLQAVATAPNMTWIIALDVVVLLVIISTIMAIVMPKFKIYQKLLDKITLLTRENLTGLRVIRAFNNDELESAKFNRENEKLTRLSIFIDTVMAVESPLMTLVFNGTTLLCILIGVSLMTTNIDYLGDMMAFMQYAIQVVMSVLFLTVLFVMIPRANVSASRINEVLHTRPKISWKKSTKGTPSDTASIEFRHVSFAYGGAEEEVLHDISFIAKAGQTTAFIGSTGSGKSTLINLVPRFFDTTSGTVLIDDVDVRDYKKEDLMQKIGYVPQRGRLFSGTVKSNITFGAPNATKEDLEEAAKISQSKEFIEKFDKQYSAPIAQGGSNVSGGQKQRLSIARAIAKHPEIYVFDDAFSALDMKTDKVLREQLKPITKDSVVLIVAQRISTIKEADQIVVLDKGKLVGRGTHYELLNNCSVYREITESQFSEAEFNQELKLARKEKK